MSNAEFDYENFKQAIYAAVEGLDEIVDENLNNHPLKQQKELSYNYRNIGLGVMGLYDMFIKLNLRYGSKESIKLIDSIMRIMFREAVFASNKIAKEKGPFPRYNSTLFNSVIIQEHFSEAEIDFLKKDGLRNCSLLSIAPTGSIANLLRISGSAEPEYALSYQRKTESLNGKNEFYSIDITPVKEYKEKTGKNKLPSWFVTALDIPWKERLEIQTVLQRHVDASISSTINLPKDIPFKEVEQLYLTAWRCGLKGITIFREGCKRVGILSTTSNEIKTNKPIKINNLDLIGRKRKLTVGCGSLHTQAWFDEITGNLMEIFLAKGSTGGCQGYMNGLSRMISLALRCGASFDNVIDQLMSVPPCGSYTGRRSEKGDTSKGSSCPSAIAFALKELKQKYYSKTITKKENFPQHLKCEKCGEYGVIKRGGCLACIYCGDEHCGD